MGDKSDTIFFICGIGFISIIFIILIFEITDFKNDYDCSTTNDAEWYIEHNCQRYER